MKLLNAFCKQIAYMLIHGYQIMVSPFIGPACRFYPSCSQYALDSIERHGLLKGAALAVKRLGKCHPFHPGGYDPVP